MEPEAPSALSATFFPSTVMTQAAAFSMPSAPLTEPGTTETVVPTFFSASVVRVMVSVFFQGA